MSLTWWRQNKKKTKYKKNDFFFIYSTIFRFTRIEFRSAAWKHTAAAKIRDEIQIKTTRPSVSYRETNTIFDFDFDFVVVVLEKSECPQYNVATGVLWSNTVVAYCRGRNIGNMWRQKKKWTVQRSFSAIVTSDYKTETEPRPAAVPPNYIRISKRPYKTASGRDKKKIKKKN